LSNVSAACGDNRNSGASCKGEIAGAPFWLIAFRSAPGLSFRPAQYFANGILSLQFRHPSRRDFHHLRRSADFKDNVNSARLVDLNHKLAGQAGGLPPDADRRMPNPLPAIGNVA
jgi:hypothetical protein